MTIAHQMPDTEDRLTVQVLVDQRALRRALLDEVRRGLLSSPRELSPRWLYDERGSQLFEAITRLPEYYPTRREREILTRHAADIANASGADTLIELGSGSSEKTRLLLGAMRACGSLRRYVPFDVSESMLVPTARALAEEYEGLRVHAVVGDFGHHLGALPRGGRRMIAFLGGTVGNLKPAERAAFYRELSAGMGPEDCFLLGTDLLKDRARLHAAYNDAAGITAEFNLNVLEVINRELGANFDRDGFRHLARFDEGNRWIEMLLLSERRQEVFVRTLDLTVTFERGEALRTEVSSKFTPDDVARELRAAGLVPERRWTDRAGDFAVTLARRADATDADA